MRRIGIIIGLIICFLNCKVNKMQKISLIPIEEPEFVNAISNPNFSQLNDLIKKGIIAYKSHDKDVYYVYYNSNTFLITDTNSFTAFSNNPEIANPYLPNRIKTEPTEILQGKNPYNKNFPFETDTLI